MASISMAGGRRIFYDETGSGPPLLLIAGFMASRGVWTRQVDVFARFFRVITIDNRDAGERDPETAPYTVSDMADDAIALLDGLGIDRAHVIGHSMGGYIALNLAARYPERIARLVLVSTSALSAGALGRPAPRYDPGDWIADPVERTHRRYAALAAPGYYDAHPDELDAIAASARGNRLSFEGMNRQSDAAFTSHDLRARLAGISVPTLVIHGDVDQVIPVQSGRKLAEGIPGARLAEWSNVGHLPHLERTTDFNETVLAFLRAADGGS